MNDYNIIDTNALYSSVDNFAAKWIAGHYMIVFSILVLIIIYILYMYISKAKAGYEGAADGTQVTQPNPLYSATPSINNYALESTIATGNTSKSDGPTFSLKFPAITFTQTPSSSKIGIFFSLIS